VEISYTVDGDFHSYKTFRSSPFTLEKIQGGDAEIAIHARQHEQGWLRVSIGIDGDDDVAHDVTTEYNGSADATYKPVHRRSTA
jgi:hypothetical protein